MVRLLSPLNLARIRPWIGIGVAAMLVLALAAGLRLWTAADLWPAAQPFALHDVATFTDPDGRMTAEEVIDGGAAFQPSPQAVPHFGTGGGVHWLRANIRRTDVSDAEAAPADAVLAVRFPYLEDVRLVTRNPDGSLAVARRGTDAAIGADPMRGPIPAFTVAVPPGEGVRVYLRLASSTVVMAPLEIETPSTFWRRTALDHALFSVMIGAILACALYVGTFYVTLREQSYLAFSIFAGLASAYVVVASGLGKMWLWPDTAGLSTALYFVIQGLLFGAAAWFFQGFLQTAENAPRSHLMLSTLAVCGLLTIVSPVMVAPIATVIYLMTALVGPVALFATLLLLWREGHPRASVATIGWGATLLVTIYLYLRVFDITPYLGINHFLAPIGFAVSVIYFAWAIAWRLWESEDRSLHDPMTGLANRRYLEIMLERHARRCARKAHGIALLHLDLDNFKQVNDTLGHEAGDRVLARAARLIRANIRKNDFAARIGGDEFVVICPFNGDRGGLAVVAERLTRVLAQPFSVDGRPCQIGASIGIAYAQGSDVDGPRLMVDSDIALYAAKSLGRNRFEFFAPALSRAFETRRRTADEILRAIANQEFVCVYQPVFDARTLELAGLEALVRWQHPERGIISPGEFLQQATDLGVTAEIDRFVLERSLADLAELRAAGHPVPHLSVNVSTRRLNDPDLVSGIAKLDLPRGLVSFELLETTFLDNLNAIAAANIAALKKLGVALDIDDFGSGHASILSLIEVGPRRLKIDRALVSRIGPAAEDQRLIRAIIEIGRSLNVAIVAEGVETAEQMRILRELGCDALQGYFLARPMALAELRAFLDRPALRRVS